jgi:hypothetical protein
MEVTNRKIDSLAWDSGAKFIFVVRDENQDSGVLSCFFPVLKNDESVTLGNVVDLRLIKNTSSCVILDIFSELFTAKDPISFAYLTNTKEF